MYVRIPVWKILIYFRTRNAKKLKLFLEIETSKTNKIPLDLVHTYILCTHCTTKYRCQVCQNTSDFIDNSRNCTYLTLKLMVITYSLMVSITILMKPTPEKHLQILKSKFEYQDHSESQKKAYAHDVTIHCMNICHFKGKIQQIKAVLFSTSISQICKVLILSHL